MKINYSCSYHHGGYRYCDTFSLESKDGKFFKYYRAGGGNMKEEISEAAFNRAVSFWDAKVGQYHEDGYLGKWVKTVS